MKCGECRERMGLYLAEALTGHWIEQFEQHIANCPDCARELREKQQVLIMLHNLPAPTPSEDLATRIKAAARAQLRQPEPQVRSAYYLKVAAACAVVVLAVGVGVIWRAPSCCSSVGRWCWGDLASAFCPPGYGSDPCAC